jgi:hypothetical protein
MRIQSIAKLSVVLMLLLGACSGSVLVGCFQVAKLPSTHTTQPLTTERLDEGLRKQVLQAVNQRSWKDIEMIVNAQPGTKEKYDALFVALEEIGKIQNDNEAKELFEQAIDYKFDTSDYVEKLGVVFYGRFSKTMDAEEEKLGQVLTIAEKKVGKANPKSVANELRNVLSKITCNSIRRARHR